ncbi:MAG: glycoside hydrolase family 3 protein, partial [Aestuariibacter sp.]|nr:glycoside hydrolase family 3 protein [Aestuariibacter sp.]
MNTPSTKGKLSLIAAAFASAALVACTSATATNPTSKADSVETTSWPTLQSPISYADEDNAFVADLVARMSTEQKVGQLMQAEIQTITPAEARQYHIGSILNGGGSVPNRQAAATARDWAVFAQ